MGCLHAALLARAGLRVEMLDHRRDRACAINRAGIVVEMPNGRFTARVRCSADPASLDVPDIVIFCVKTFQSSAAARHAAPLVGAKTVVLRLQNGLADPSPFVQISDEPRVVLGTSGHGANTVAWGHIRHAGQGPTRLGPLVPTGLAAAELVAEALRPAFADTEIVPDVMAMLWRKLVVNAAINPLTALTGLRNGQLLDVPLLRSAMADITAEAENVARAAGVALRPGEALALTEAACRQTAANRSSMLQDVQSGRRTEIDDINGAIVREGARLGIYTPINKALLWLLTEVGLDNKANGRPLQLSH